MEDVCSESPVRAGEASSSSEDGDESVLMYRVYSKGEWGINLRTGRSWGLCIIECHESSPFVVSLSNYERAALRQAQGER